MAHEISVSRRVQLKEAGKICESHHVFLAVADASESVWLIQTNDFPIEFNFHLNGDGLFHVQGHEVASIQTAGTNKGILNHDFRVTETPVQSISIGNSYSVTSTFYEEIFGSGAGPGGKGGGAGSLEEDLWILQANKIYAFGMTNLTGNSANIGFDADWFDIK